MSALYIYIILLFQRINLMQLKPPGISPILPLPMHPIHPLHRQRHHIPLLIILTKRNPCRRITLHMHKSYRVKKYR